MRKAKERHRVNMRFQSKKQVELFQRAAAARRWSLNTFMLVAAEELAEKIEQELVEKISNKIVDMPEVKV